MKKYSSLSELILDYRDHNKMTQVELSVKLNVDVRTISRWEQGESLIKPEKERDFVKELFIPHQVVHNLNSEYPIAVYYDIYKRIYSISSLNIDVINASWYKFDFPMTDDRIIELNTDSDIDFIEDIKEMRTDITRVDPVLIKTAAKVLPELNFILEDQSGLYAGHSCIIPLRYDIYRQMREKKRLESSITSADLEMDLTELPHVFYIYSFYADNLENEYYIINRIFQYFRDKKYTDYMIAGIAYQEKRVDILREMGLKVVWEKVRGDESGYKDYLFEGNLDMFLFGKMN